jgi:hypothetical protein
MRMFDPAARSCGSNSINGEIVGLLDLPDLVGSTKIADAEALNGEVVAST